MPKAGSTSIQRTLKLNSVPLSAAGVGFAFDSYGDLIAWAKGKSSSLSSFWSNTAPDANKVLLSNEKLFSKLMRPSEIERVLNELSLSFGKKSVLCYLRRHDEVFVSSYSTYLLGGGTSRFSKLDKSQPWSALSRLRIWEDAVGAENMIVRRFGATYFSNGDLVGDFLGAMKLPELAICKKHTGNSSPSIEVMEMQRLVNVLCPNAPDRRRLVKILGNAQIEGLSLGLSAEDRRRITEGYEAEYREIANRYFGCDELFIHPYLDDPAPEVTLTNSRIAALTRKAIGWKAGALLLPRCVRNGSLSDAMLWAVEELRRHIARQDERKRKKKGRRKLWRDSEYSAGAARN